MQDYFTDDELRCKCGCGVMGFKQLTRHKLNLVRKELGQPMVITSGYRCEAHNTKNGYTQTHASGQAVDIRADRKYAYKLLKILLNHGFTGIGIKQKGQGRIIHADDLEEDLNNGVIRPTIWSY